MQELVCDKQLSEEELIELDTCKYCGHVGLSFSRDLYNAGYYCGECGKFANNKVEE